MSKRLFNIVFFLSLIFFSLINIGNKSMASTKLTGIENFPDSYKPYLYELKSRYPNWEFTALYTGIDWNTAVSEEYGNDKNLVPLSYSDNWKCKEFGKYNIEIDDGWVNASRQAIEYTMDPRNFLNEVRVFQFEKLTYDENINNENGVDKILYGTEFYNRYVSYKNANGNTINTQDTYAHLIMDAGIYSGVSPYHLAARIKQEVGPFITHSSISGEVEGYKGLYNFYNIGATSSPEPLGAIKKGLQYALNGKNALSESELENQLIPWNTPERAIKGGAVFIGKSYILVGQNCLYLQKFDMNNDRGNDLFWHQYMTNCLAPYSEAKSMYNGYSTSGILNSSIGFVIPIYENMPSQPVSSPAINASDYVPDNTKVYANVSTNLNVRTGPGTSYEVLKSIPANETFTRIGQGVQNGERWDKVLLNNGMIGYVFQAYVEKVPPPSIISIELSIADNVINTGDRKAVSIKITPEDSIDKIIWRSSNENVAIVENGEVYAISNGNVTITAQTENGNVSDSIDLVVTTPVNKINIDNTNIRLIVGKSMKLNANIIPDNASNKNLIWSSDDKNIATVDVNGQITAISEGETTIRVKVENENVSATCNVKVIKIQEGVYFELDEKVNLNGDEISGVSVDNIGEFRKLINTNLTVEFYNANGKILEDTDVIGTGCRLCVKNDKQEEIYNYYFIIYGDINGDGAINALDVLVLQKYILEIKQLEGLYLKAGNISKNGNLPSALDVLKIQKHILEIKLIEQ